MLPPSPPAIVWQQPSAQSTQVPPATAMVCDTTGVIQCSVSERITQDKGQEDIRMIATYVALLSERNRRFYLAWNEKLPSAAYEVVRRIHQFPYLPYGDMYAITDMRIVLEEDRNRITVRYPKRPDSKPNEELPETDYVVYDAPLAPFMKAIEKEIGKLKKYAKPASVR